MEADSEIRRLRPVEFVVIMMCNMALLALFLPACHSGAGESARRAQCVNNLKNIALGLENYHDIHGTYPMGAMHAGDRESPRIGPSWWYAILPYMEHRNVYEMISRTQTRGYEPGGIEFTYASMPDTEQDQIQTRLRKLAPDYMHCPSSPLPVMDWRNDRSRYIAMPSYVGISGGCDIDPDSGDYDLHLSKPSTHELYVNRSKGIGPNGSIVTSSGMLPPMEHIRSSQCTDGTSNTMIVGEQSDWLKSVNLKSDATFHGDPGWNTQTDLNPGGWLSGTNAVDSVGPATSNGLPGTWRADWLFNLTTVRTDPQRKRVFSFVGDALPGCAEVMGHNNPLQSPHLRGFQVGFADCSMRFVSSSVDLTVLLRLAIRDDGVSVELE